MDGFTLTGWQRRRLERQLREADDVPLYRRTAALLEVARGRSAAEVARTLGVSRQSVYNWVAAYAAGHALLAEDETDLLLFPPLRAGWALRGRPAEVPLSGRNARRVVFGALNLRTGYRLLLDREHQRAGDFQAFLRFVRSHYRGWHVVMLLDED